MTNENDSSKRQKDVNQELDDVHFPSFILPSFCRHSTLGTEPMYMKPWRDTRKLCLNDEIREGEERARNCKSLIL